MGDRRGRWPLSLAAGLILALPAVAIVLVAWTPIGGWLQSFVAGSGVRWEDAYRALESAESKPSGPYPDRERLLLAWARAEGDPPVGLRLGPRLHSPGTLAHLRYETFDARGERADAWQVRALVPRLPDFAARAGREHPLLGRMECPPECRAELARSNGTLLTHSGEPGLAAEWVLRMPVGPTFELGQRPLVTQDILAAAPRRLGLTSRREGGRQVLEPASIRVTLVEVCPATIRVGALARLEFYPDATVPIPRGFRTVRWVQLDGCTSLLSKEA